MEKYGITYSILASGYIEREAHSLKEAEEAILEADIGLLLAHADLNDSFLVDVIEGV